MRMPTGTPPVRISLDEREKLYNELSSTYNGWPDTPEEMSAGRTALNTAISSGITPDLLRRQVKLASESVEPRFRGKFSNLVANRFWERHYRAVIPHRPFQPPRPHKGPVPPD